MAVDTDTKKNCVDDTSQTTQAANQIKVPIKAVFSLTEPLSQEKIPPLTPLKAAPYSAKIKADGKKNKIEDYRLQAVSWSSINKAKARFYWKAYYDMFNSFTTPVDFYYDGRLIRKKSFDYSYAITTHKSQGSTFNNVLVDIKNINCCQDENVRRQLQYVALSRTQHDALIYQ